MACSRRGDAARINALARMAQAHARSTAAQPLALDAMALLQPAGWCSCAQSSATLASLVETLAADSSRHQCSGRFRDSARVQ